MPKLKGGVVLSIQDNRWKKTFPHLRSLVEKALYSVLDLNKTEVSLVFADDNFVHSLNKTYRGKDSPTNVLSFPMSQSAGGVWLAGDIVLAFDTVCREAENQHKTFEAHLTHLIVHGALHLKGFDHILEKEALLMETKEIEILKTLGFDNPYQQRDEK